jgi:catechol 2,3-dioxygenase-like lactoylglutathione lyase family enzyme
MRSNHLLCLPYAFGSIVAMGAQHSSVVRTRIQQGRNAMKITGIAFIGVRTAQFEEMRHLFGDVMGMETTRQEPDTAGFRFDRTTVELYSPEDEFHSFFPSGPVLGFRVEDFDAAHDELTAAGAQWIGEVQHEDGVSWNHFRAPDGNVYEIVGPGRYRPELA